MMGLVGMAVRTGDCQAGRQACDESSGDEPCSAHNVELWPTPAQGAFAANSAPLNPSTSLRGVDRSVVAMRARRTAIHPDSRYELHTEKLPAIFDQDLNSVDRFRIIRKPEVLA